LSTLLEARQAYVKTLNEKAFEIAKKYCSKKKITLEILKVIIELYESAKYEIKIDGLSSAYHNPITSDFELFIALIITNIIKLKKINWNVDLRRQKNKSVPDIRIYEGEITKSIIEIKAKAGWMQPFFSKERYNFYLEKYHKNTKNGKSPQLLIDEQKNMINKYSSEYDIGIDKIFYLLPTYEMVWRKRKQMALGENAEDFNKLREYFGNISGLGHHNLIVLSEKLNLNLSNPGIENEFKETEYFENYLNELFV
jgi:hypothetical protein